MTGPARLGRSTYALLSAIPERAWGESGYFPLANSRRFCFLPAESERRHAMINFAGINLKCVAEAYGGMSLFPVFGTALG